MTPIKNIQKLTQPAHVAQITGLALTDSRSYLLSAQVHCEGPDPVLINLQRSFVAYFKENYMSSICNETRMVPVSFPFFLSLLKNYTPNYNKTKQKIDWEAVKIKLLSVELCFCLRVLFVWSSEVQIESKNQK